eukprot:161116_1
MNNMMYCGDGLLNDTLQDSCQINDHFNCSCPQIFVTTTEEAITTDVGPTTEATTINITSSMFVGTESEKEETADVVGVTFIVLFFIAVGAVLGDIPDIC